jgi:hypothetical protein
VHDGKRWSEEKQASASSHANDWEPSLAVAGDGRRTVVWDTYDRATTTWSRATDSGTGSSTGDPVAATAAFESRLGRL